MENAITFIIHFLTTLFAYEILRIFQGGKRPLAPLIEPQRSSTCLLGSSACLLGSSTCLLGSSTCLLGSSTCLLGSAYFLLGSSTCLLGSSTCFLLGSSTCLLHIEGHHARLNNNTELIMSYLNNCVKLKYQLEVE